MIASTSAILAAIVLCLCLQSAFGGVSDQAPSKSEDVFTPDNCDRFVQSTDHVLTEYELEFRNGTRDVVVAAPQQLHHVVVDINAGHVLRGLKGMCENSTRKFTWPSSKNVDLKLFPVLSVLPEDEEFSLIVRVVHITTQDDYQIFEALKTKKISQVLDLIDEHKGVNAVDEWGQSPLIIAVVHNMAPVLSALLNARLPKVNVNYAKPSGFTALFYAVERSNEAIVRALLRRGADPNMVSLQEGSRGNTPLHYACFLEKTKHAEVLLQYGANPIAINEHGQNALQMVPANALRSTKLYLKKIFEDAFDKNQRELESKNIDVNGN